MPVEINQENMSINGVKFHVQKDFESAIKVLKDMDEEMKSKKEIIRLKMAIVKKRKLDEKNII